MNYLTPLQSNYPYVQKCWVYRKDRPDRIRKSTLPSPTEVRLRMEIALMRADIARPAYEAAQRQKAILAKIADLEERIASY